MALLEVRDARWASVTDSPVELVVDASQVGEFTAHRVTAAITLTRHTRLRSIAAEAVAQGARKVRVSPCGADEIDLVRAAVDVRRIALEHAVDIQFDVAPRTLLLVRPDAFLRLDPLVVERDGTVVPVCAGLDRRYALGSLADATLAELVREWDNTAALELCRATWRRAIGGRGPLVAWHDQLIKMAGEG